MYMFDNMSKQCQKLRMSKALDAYVPICDAIALLLWPHAEAVLHDLSKGDIFYIANSYSKRRAGDRSLNDPDQHFDPTQTVIGPYAKTNWNGNRLKSVTTVIRDSKNKAIGLLCINHDIEVFSGVLDQLKGLIELPPPAPKQSALLSQDWRETVNATIAEFLQWRKITLAGLTSSETEDLLKNLESRGIFEIRNAVPYVAEILRVSRATIYNRLNAIRPAGNPRVKVSHRSK
jgi:D-arginine utilization repressor